MKRLPLISALFICMLSICACSIKSDKKAGEEEINAKKAEFEKYLEDTYPDETFTVEIWQEYGTKTGAAGLPDYEGYMLRQVITDFETPEQQIEQLNKINIKANYTDRNRLIFRKKPLGHGIIR